MVKTAKRKKWRAPIHWNWVRPPSAFNKLYRPLGYIVVTFADMEQMLTYALGQLLRRPYGDVMALEQIMQSLTSRIKFFYYLASQATQDAAKENPEFSAVFKKMHGEASAIHDALLQANSDRNNLLHSSWTGIGVEKDRSFAKARYKADGGKLTELGVRGITLKVLADEAKFFMSVRLRLWDWLNRMQMKEDAQNWPEPLPKRYLLQSPLKNLLQANKSKVP